MSGSAKEPEEREKKMTLRVKHVMAEAVTVSPSDGLYVADRLMSQNDRRPLPVVKGAVLVGILTHGDILRAPRRLAPGRAAAEDAGAALRGLRVQEAMTRAVITIGPEASVNEAVEQLLRHRVQCLPVIQDGRLVGLFTESSLLRAIAWPREGASDPGAGISPAPVHAGPSHLWLEA